MCFTSTYQTSQQVTCMASTAITWRHSVVRACAHSRVVRGVTYHGACLWLRQHTSCQEHPCISSCSLCRRWIEVEGGNEIPVLDNSALGWSIDVQCAGLRPAPVQGTEEDEEPSIMQRDLLILNQGVAVQDTDGWISYFPAPFAKLTAGVDHSYIAPVIGTQWYTWHTDDTHFRYAVAPARAYVESIDELFALREEGYLRAGAENLFLVANGDQWWDSSMVRMVYDEPARFKLSQLVGNLSLLSVRGSQGMPVGHITAFNASPALQLSFAQAVYEAVEQESFTAFEQVLELQDSYLEQRYGKYGGGDDDVGDEGEDEDLLYTTSVGPAEEYEDEEEYEEGELAEGEEFEEAEEEDDEAAEAEAGDDGE
eukprot:GHUV01003997.1.p1 GENE.GHUV01003997.1~~GHUV01003997.1.p1  ORF type:complete len:368 (+),score=57.01 GHUV01003997.1:819-1922(+)